MKIVKLFFALLMILSIGMVSCDSLEVENLNAPDRERALANPSDLLQILKGGTVDLFWGTTDLHGVWAGLLSDQSTATNKYLAFWDFAEEPRMAFNNSVTYDASGFSRYCWNSLNSTVVSANSIIQAIADGIVLEEVSGSDTIDRTSDAEIAAYFIKGAAQGFLGAWYDKGYIVDIDSDLGALEFVDYKALIAAGLANIQTAIDKANAASSLTFDFMLKVDMDKARFIQMCNSYRAKIAISEARTKDETIQTPYATISSWVDAGFDTDFTINTSPNDWWHNGLDWYTYRLSSADGAGYIPTDHKIMHLINPNHYEKYYHPDTGFYAPLVTNDMRFHTTTVFNGTQGYYFYVQNFGYLNPNRNRYLFTVYTNNKWWNFNQIYVDPDYPNPIFLTYEGDLIKAECDLKGGSTAGTLAVMNDPTGPRKALGMLPDVTIANEAEAINYLHLEHSFELDHAAMAVGQWAFMRRWDLLQKGTPLHAPVPARELEATGKEIYTFGGVDNATNPGTATGTGAWKPYPNGDGDGV